MDKVAVIMSTYNGEKYLREQIDSILAQEDVEVTLFVRDDGSGDGTVEILREYQKRGDIQLHIGENVGIGNSFMQVFFAIKDEYDFYAFSDQDDIWLSNKLKCAIDMLKKEDAGLYGSNQTIVDADGNGRDLRLSEPLDTTYMSVINRGTICGCTMVWNKRLFQTARLKSHHPSKMMMKCRMHDTWLIMVALLTDKIVFDMDSYILYRQHATNVVGVRKTGIFFGIKERMNKLIRPEYRYQRSRFCREVYEKFYDYLTEEQREDFYMLGFYQANWKEKKCLLRDKRMVRYTGESLAEFRLKVMMNII